MSTTTKTHHLYRAALAADVDFSEALTRHNLDRWSDTRNWPGEVKAAFVDKAAADEACSAAMLGDA